MSTWFRRKWQEDKTGENWEDFRVGEDNPDEVIQGLRSLSRAPSRLAPKKKGDSRKLLSYGNQVGRSVNLPTLVPGPGEPVAILDLTADDEEARAISLHFVSSLTISPTTGQLENEPDITGVIEWGSGGVQATARFDWLRGTTLSIIGSFIRISAINNGDPSGVLTGDVRVGVFAGYNPIAGGMRGRQPQLTDGIVNLAAASSSSPIDVPRFATNVVVQRTGTGGATSVEVEMSIVYNNRFGVAVYETHFAADELMTFPVDLSNDIRSIVVQNRDAVNAATFKIIWGLAF